MVPTSTLLPESLPFPLPLGTPKGRGGRRRSPRRIPFGTFCAGSTPPPNPPCSLGRAPCWACQALGGRAGPSALAPPPAPGGLTGVLTRTFQRLREGGGGCHFWRRTVPRAPPPPPPPAPDEDGPKPSSGVGGRGWGRGGQDQPPWRTRRSGSAGLHTAGPRVPVTQRPQREGSLFGSPPPPRCAQAEASGVRQAWAPVTGRGPGTVSPTEPAEAAPSVRRPMGFGPRCFPLSRSCPRGVPSCRGRRTDRPLSGRVCPRPGKRTSPSLAAGVRGGGPGSP